MKFPKQLFYRTQADDCFFGILMKMPSVFGKGMALYWLKLSKRDLTNVTIIHKKWDFVVTI